MLAADAPELDTAIKVVFTVLVGLVLARLAASFGYMDDLAGLTQLAAHHGSQALKGLSGGIDLELIARGIRGESADLDEKHRERSRLYGGMVSESDEGDEEEADEDDLGEGSSTAGPKAWGDTGEFYPGLVNAAGNLCFLNATLQSLASVTSLPPYLSAALPAGSASTVLSRSPSPIISHLQLVLGALNTPRSSPPNALSPFPLARAIAESSTQRRALLSSREQQDAQEFLGIVLESIGEEVERLSKTSQSDWGGSRILGSMLKGKGSAESGLRALLASPHELPPPLSQMPPAKQRSPFAFLTAQRVTCTICNYTESVRHSVWDQLTLNVPAVPVCALEDCLREYTAVEYLSDYICRKCSMLATLSRLRAHRERILSGVGPAEDQTTDAPMPTANGAASEEEKAALTVSRKKRARAVGRQIERVEAALNAGDMHRQMEGGKDGIRVEKIGVMAGKETKIARSPKALVLHLSRSNLFSPRGHVIKNQCQVVFPEYLDLQPFEADVLRSEAAAAKAPTDGTHTARDLFKLVSVVVHYGTHSFGHYVAFRRRPPPPEGRTDLFARKEWIRMSDETVDFATTDEVRRCNPFLLFYERVTQEEQLLSVPSTEEVPPVVRPRVIQSWSAGERERTSRSRQSSVTTHE